MRTYEVGRRVPQPATGSRIETEISDFRVSLDPNSLDSQGAQQAREALRTALAALDAQADHSSE